uniref:Uncharacterized protein n=1 Tax=Sinocyclocheilus rhinocerous TaxID=307959 RepID=A0A673N3C1_9TELE
STKTVTTWLNEQCILMSLYSVGDFGDVVVSGRIQFLLQYDVKKEELHVHIIRCQELASACKNRSDPEAGSVGLEPEPTNLAQPPAKSKPISELI